MELNQYIQNLRVPQGHVDAVIDSDAFNEVDDQFAIAYLLAAREKVSVQALYAAPFFNALVRTPQEGMEKSHAEIRRLVALAGRPDLDPCVLQGSARYLADEQTPVHSDAAADLVCRSKAYSPQRPLYVVAIGALTDVASALLLDASIAERIVLVWLGGHSFDSPDIREFNMRSDYAAARVVFHSDVPLVLVPCRGVANAFVLSFAEMQLYLQGHGPLCDLLVERVRHAERAHLASRAVSRVLWDVTAAAWLLNDGDRFLCSELRPCPVPQPDGYYAFPAGQRLIRYVSAVERDSLATDLLQKLTDGACFA